MPVGPLGCLGKKKKGECSRRKAREEGYLSSRAEERTELVAQEVFSLALREKKEKGEVWETTIRKAKC